MFLESYEKRLKQLDMFPLHERRIREDLIEFFKILNKFDKISPEKRRTFHIVLYPRVSVV